MIALRKSLTTFLKTIHPRVYHERAPSTAVFPYLVFECPLYPDGEGSELCMLSIDGWDNKLDTTALETLMALVRGNKDPVTDKPTGLDKKTLINPEQVVTFYIDNMLSIVDDDESVKRRQYNFSGKLHRRG